MDSGVFRGDKLTDANPELCATIFGSGDDQESNPPVNEEASVEPGAEAQCESLAKLSERRQCLLRARAPSCKESVKLLEDDAKILTVTIEDELSKFGDLLSKDYMAIDNRALLCQFSLADLDESFEQASQNPQVLRAIQSEAQGIQACQREWEEFVRSNASAGTSDTLVDTVAREAEEQLRPLKERIQGLSDSIVKLEDAAEIIERIVDIHLVYCDPDGTKIPD